MIFACAFFAACPRPDSPGPASAGQKQQTPQEEANVILKRMAFDSLPSLQANVLRLVVDHGDSTIAPQLYAKAKEMVDSIDKTAEEVRLAARWTVSEDKSEMDGTLQVSLHLVAEEPIKTWLDQVTPSMIIRCKERKVDTYIITESAADVAIGHIDEARVRLRFDEQPPSTQWWNESTDDKAIFAPSGLNLALKLTHASTFRVEFTPFNASPEVIRFDVRGLTSNLPKVLDACKVRYSKG
jgi:hypothetical protein